MAEKFNRATFTKNFLRNITRVKAPDEMLAEAKSQGLEKTLGVIDLIVLGVGAIIGSGIFAVVGIAAAGAPDGSSVGAGPALIVSMIIAAFACVFSALCYSEFATMIPVAGGAYTYTFATLGEFAAWMVGWVLMLEYAIGFIAVACAWSNHFVEFMAGFQHIAWLPHWLTAPPAWLTNDIFTLTALKADNPAVHVPTLFGMPIGINLPAILIVILITAILVKGTKDSAKIAGIMVFIKLFVIALFVIAGAFFVTPANWTPFAPHGAEGIFAGAFLIFFAYIGFDALATAAEECKNPQKDLPIGILGSLVITTIVYILVAIVLTGIQDTSGAVPLAFLKAPLAYCMIAAHQNWAAGLISIGALAGLTSVLLVLEMASTRILFAMSRDHFISQRFQKLDKKTKTPALLTWTVGVLAIVGILTLNLNVAAELCNYGTFTSFIIVCIAVLILRHTDPNRERPFKVPFSPVTPALGILCCGGLMIYKSMQSSGSALLFPVWLGIGAIIYILYGFIKNRNNENAIHRELVHNKPKEQEISK
ncbi:MAG: amino acid permease [Clostridiaceae bacterium]|jgi:basic amino acid/polyamine antiporter, APA family|nr:amino acid permease [Clostridiaceae bacterium]